MTPQQVGVKNLNSEATEYDGLEDENSETEAETDAEVEAPVLRRSTRERRPSERYTPENYILRATDDVCAFSITGDDPSTVKQARSSEDAKQWEEAMKEEMKSLMKNQTWSLENLPADRKAIGCKWVFKKKFGANGEIERYKARLVAKGYSQTEGVDYGEVFSPVAKLNSIRLVLSVAAAYDLEVEQLDVKTAFLHGDLEEVIFMKQPEGFAVKGKENLVCKLNKSLYGLKQSPRMWYLKFDTYVVKLGFDRCDADHCVYVKRLDDDFVILTLYVDDMLLVGNSSKMISTVKGLLAKQFEMKDLGAANVILGIQIRRERDKRKLWLSQRKYIEDVLKKFKMTDCKPVLTPMSTGSRLSAEQCPKTEEEKEEMASVPYASAVGSLMYAMICTRPDIAQAVGVLSRYMSKPGHEHWTAVKRVFRYLRGTSDLGLCYEHMEGSRGQTLLELRCFVDADWGGDIDSRRSTSGYVVSSFGGAISWMSKRQSTVALSTTEAEYMALTHAVKEVIWMRRLCKELGFAQGDVTVGCDSQSAIFLAKNPGFHARTKHIGIQYHFVREKVEDRTVLLEKVDTKVNAADFLTKAVTTEKFEWCTTALGLKKHAKHSPSGRMLGMAHSCCGPGTVMGL